ncbi:MAG: hypothetical protein SCJ94_11925 [Bacillota bacterium]|nr:hypothetical protein [Bacillota bacterium]
MSKYITGSTDKDYSEYLPGGQESFSHNYDIHDVAFGLDLGEARDYSALSIVRRTIKVDRQRSGAVVPDELKYCAPVYQLIYLKRWPLHISYSKDVVQDVKKMLQEGWPGEEKKPYLVLDYTGVGRAVLDIFRQVGMSPIGIHTSNGDRVHWIPGGYSVPKRDLIGVLTSVFQRGEIQIPAKLPDLKILMAELANFKIKVTAKGNDTYEHAKSTGHDDTVISLALALFYLYNLRPKANSRHSMIRKIQAIDN